jgi:heme exporter protein D
VNGAPPDELLASYGSGHFGSFPEWVSYATPAIVLIVLLAYVIWRRRR